MQMQTGRINGRTSWNRPWNKGTCGLFEWSMLSKYQQNETCKTIGEKAQKGIAKTFEKNRNEDRKL